MQSHPVLGWLAASLLLASSAGCQRGPAKLKVAFVTNNPESFWSIAEAGTKKAAAEEDVEVLFRKPPRATPPCRKRSSIPF